MLMHIYLTAVKIPTTITLIYTIGHLLFEGLQMVTAYTAKLFGLLRVVRVCDMLSGGI